MSKYYNSHIAMSIAGYSHLLGGLAKAYKDLPSWINNYSELKTELQLTIEYILNDLHRQGVKVQANPFKTYVQLINWQPIEQLTI